MSAARCLPGHRRWERLPDPMSPNARWPDEFVKGNSLMDAINTLFTNLLNIGLGVAVTVAAFYLMVGAFLYMSASGSPHQMERGKSAMPEDLVRHLTRPEVRDLVEFLADLK